MVFVSAEHKDDKAKVNRPQTDPNMPETLEAAAKLEIDNMLSEIWKLGKDERTKAIRRLYLRWHPDKNPKQIDLCTKAFKHLQYQIDQLEKTGRLNGGSKESPFKQHRKEDFSDSFFKDFFRQWEFEAR